MRIALALDGGTLAIQGPPGTGKTYTGARMILALVAAGKTVGVTANSHKVIGNVLDAVVTAAQETGARTATGARIAIGQKPGKDEEPTCAAAEPLGDARDIAAALAAGTLHVVGGTAWLWSAAAMAGSVDVLLVDEAGQFSLANTVAVSPAGRSLVLLGDPQQLDQPLKGSHPPGAERSALAHLLAGAPGEPPHATMPPERGLFIEKTWRLHPAICAYTSELFYASQLHPVEGLEHQAIGGAPLWRTAASAGCPSSTRATKRDRSRRPGRSSRLVRDLLDGGARWTNRHGVEAPLRLEDIVVVAPYNAHVDQIAATLASRGLPGGARRHRRQVPGPGGAALHLRDGILLARGRAARHGVPVLAQPAQRGHVARTLRGARGGVARPRPRLLRDAPPDAARQRALPAGRGGGSPVGSPPRERLRKSMPVYASRGHQAHGHPNRASKLDGHHAW